MGEYRQASREVVVGLFVEDRNEIGVYALVCDVDGRYGARERC